MDKEVVVHILNGIFSSVQFSHSVVSDSLPPHELQHTRPPCSSPTPGVHSNSCASSRWCHLIFCHPLLFLPSIFSSIRIFSNESVLRIRCPKLWSFSFSINPSKEYSGLISFRTDWFDLLSLLPKGLSSVFSSTTIEKHQFSGTQSSLWSNFHIHTWLLEKS